MSDSNVARSADAANNHDKATVGEPPPPPAPATLPAVNWPWGEDPKASLGVNGGGR